MGDMSTEKISILKGHAGDIEGNTLDSDGSSGSKIEIPPGEEGEGISIDDTSSDSQVDTPRAAGYEKAKGFKNVESRLAALEGKLGSTDAVNELSLQSYTELQELINEVREQMGEGDAEGQGMYGVARDPALEANLARIEEFEEMIFGEPEKAKVEKKVENKNEDTKDSKGEKGNESFDEIVKKLRSVEGRAEIKTQFENLNSSIEARLRDRGVLENQLDALEAEGKLKGWKRFKVARESLRPIFENLTGNEQFSAGVLAAYSGLIQEFLEASKELEASLGAFVDSGMASAVDTSPASIAPEIESYRTDRKEWSESRAEMKEIEKEYLAALPAYYEDAAKKGLWSALWHRRENKEKDRVFKELEEKYTNARVKYVGSLESALGGRKALHSVDNPQKFDFENSNVRAALAKKTILEIRGKRQEVRKEMIEKHQSKAAAVFEKTMTVMAKHKWKVRIAAYSIGVTAAGLGAAGVIALRMGLGIAGGAVGAAGTEGIYNKAFTSKRREAVAENEAIAKRQINKDTFKALDRNLSESDTALEKSIRNKRIATVAGGIIGGGAGYAAGGGLESAFAKDVPEAVPDTAAGNGSENPPEAGDSEALEIDNNLNETSINAENRAAADSVEKTVGYAAEQNAENVSEVTAESNPQAIIDEHMRQQGIMDAADAGVSQEATDPVSEHMRQQAIMDAADANQNIETTVENTAETTLAQDLENAQKSAEADLASISAEAQEAPSNTVTVEKGDNLWNLMEGEGPDSNPVGGHSEFVKDMPQAERNEVLTEMRTFMQQNPEFTKSVGITSGNPDLIHPGENIDIGAIDAKLMELRGGGAASLDVSGPTPETLTAAADTSVAEANSADAADNIVAEATSEEATATETAAPTLEASAGEPTTLETVSPVTPETESVNIGQMKVDDIMTLYKEVGVGNADALAKLGELGLDKSSLQDAVDQITALNPGDIDGNMLYNDYLEAYTPADIEIPATYDPEFSQMEIDNPSMEQLNTSPSAGEAVNKWIAETVKNIEAPKPGFFFNSEPGYEGSYEKFADMTIGEMREMGTNEEVFEKVASEKGITPEMFNRWAENLTPLINETVNDNYKIADVLEAAAKSNVA